MHFSKKCVKVLVVILTCKISLFVPSFTHLMSFFRLAKYVWHFALNWSPSVCSSISLTFSCVSLKWISALLKGTGDFEMMQKVLLLRSKSTGIMLSFRRRLMKELFPEDVSPADIQVEFNYFQDNRAIGGLNFRSHILTFSLGTSIPCTLRCASYNIASIKSQALMI